MAGPSAKWTSPLLELLFDEPSLGRCLVAPDGSVLRANGEWLRSTGFSPGEVLGADIIDRFPGWSVSPVELDGGTGLLLTARPAHGDGGGVLHENEARPREREEEALRRYELIAANSRDIILFMRRDDGRILEANAAATKAYGYSHEELLALTIHDLRAPDSRRWTAGQMSVADDRGILFETVHRRKDGTTFPVEVSSQGSNVGSARSLISVIRDITERKRAETVLQTTMQRFYRVLSSMYSAVLLVTNEGRVEFANKAFCDRFHLEDSPAQLVELGSADMIEKIKRGHLHPDEAIARIRDILGRGQPVIGEELAMQDGGTCLRDFVPLNVDGTSYGRLWIHVDITARKRAEEALRDNEERYRSFFDNLSEAVVVLDAVRDERGAVVDWRCAASNDAHRRLFGLAREDIVGALMSQVMGRDRLDQLHARNCRVLATGESVTEELELRGRRLTSTVFRIGSETLAITALDVTERRQAEDTLREADRRKTEFLAVLSHELRNPLAPIRNSIRLLEQAAPGSEQASRAKEVIQRQTEHLTRLVDDLLDITRVSRGKVTLQRTLVDLGEIVRKTTVDLRSLFDRGEVALRVEQPAGPVWVDADATRLSQVVGNLLHNAVKFTPPHGTVLVGIATSEGWAELHVRDTGIGMESQHLEAMFEPFAQAEHDLARTKGGLGLGLALVKGLTELHGGSVQARSEGLGRGAEFIVRLPLSAVEGSSRPEPRPATGPSGRSILIIEDNVDAGQTLAELLELQGHRVRVAFDGRSGMALARELRPEVVLCDLGLPDVDGYEVARALRRDDTLRSTRLIALSGYAQPEDKQRAREAGFDAHLAKPPRLDELSELLASES